MFKLVSSIAVVGMASCSSGVDSSATKTSTRTSSSELTSNASGNTSSASNNSTTSGAPSSAASPNSKSEPAPPTQQSTAQPSGSSTTTTTTTVSSNSGGPSPIAAPVLSFKSTWFDGVSKISINLTDGTVTYGNTAVMRAGLVPSIQFEVTDSSGAISHVTVPLDGSVKIPHWLAATGAHPSGFDKYTSPESAPRSSPSVSSKVSGNILTIIVDDDLGNRPGMVNFPNCDLGLQY